MPEIETFGHTRLLSWYIYTDPNLSTIISLTSPFYSFPPVQFDHVGNSLHLCYKALAFLRKFQSLFLGKLGQKEDCKCFWKNKSIDIFFRVLGRWFHWKFWVNKQMKMILLIQDIWEICMYVVHLKEYDKGRGSCDSMQHLPSCIFIQRTLCPGSIFLATSEGSIKKRLRYVGDIA